MGKRSVIKGKVWEREVAQDLRDVTGITDDEVRRGAQQSRSGSDQPDVLLPGWWLECKVGQQQNPREALRQAIRASAGRATPAAIIKDNGSGSREPFRFVAMRYEDFLMLTGALVKQQQIVDIYQTTLAELRDRMNAAAKTAKAAL